MDRGKLVEPMIHRRPDGKYLFRHRDGSKETTKVFDTVSDARLFKRRFLLGDTDTLGAKSINTTLQEILNSYVAYLDDKRSRSARDVEWVSKRIISCFGERHTAPLSANDMDTWAEWVMEKTASRGELIARGVRILRTAHLRAKLPVPPKPEFEIERGHRIRVPLETAKAFFAQLAVGSPEWAAANLMKYTLTRLEHVLALRVSDIKAGYLLVKTRKGRAGQRASIDQKPITPQVRGVLDVIAPRGTPADRHLILVDGHPITSANSLRKRLIAASQRAGIEPPIQSLAWIRNFAITQLVEKKVPIEVVSRMAGHASVKTTERFYDEAELLQDRIAASATLSELLDLPLNDSTETPPACPEMPEDDLLAGRAPN